MHGNALVDGTLVASKLVAGTITGDKISAGTINAGHLAVGDFANLVVDANGDSGVSPFGSSYVVDVGNGTHAYRCTEGARDSWGNLMPVQSGDQYYFSADVSWVSGAQSRCGIGMSFVDSSGNFVNHTLAASTTTYNSSTWTRITGVLTVPSGYYRGCIWWQRDGFGVEGCGVWNMRNLQIRKRIDGGDLIVAGTITGDRLVASTITGSKIAADTITSANIAAGTITANEIAAGTITASKLAAGTITGDKIAAGQTLSSPNISGGTLTLGSGNNMSFQEGGAAGFGKGGPYGGWGYGWNTIIYADGGIYTNRLSASGGTFTGTVNANAGTFNNVTINSNCDVKGTIYADKIVGDVVAAKMSNKSQTYTITSSPKTRFLTATAQVNASRYTSQYENLTATASLNLYVDGVLKDTGSVEAPFYGPGTASARGTASVKATISANANHTYRLEWNGGDGAIPAILFAETSGSIY